MEVVEGVVGCRDGWRRAHRRDTQDTESHTQSTLETAGEKPPLGSIELQRQLLHLGECGRHIKLGVDELNATSTRVCQLGAQFAACRNVAEEGESDQDTHLQTVVQYK